MGAASEHFRHTPAARYLAVSRAAGPVAAPRAQTHEEGGGLA